MKIEDEGKTVNIDGLEFYGDLSPMIFLEECDRSYINLNLEELKAIRVWVNKAIQAEEVQAFQDNLHLKRTGMSIDDSFKDYKISPKQGETATLLIGDSATRKSSNKGRDTK